MAELRCFPFGEIFHYILVVSESPIAECGLSHNRDLIYLRFH